MENKSFWKQCNPIEVLSTIENYFSLSVIYLTLSVNPRIFVNTNTKRMERENCFEKNSSSSIVNYGIHKIRLQQQHLIKFK